MSRVEARRNGAPRASPPEGSKGAPSFDPMAAPLEGIDLIEANAGTGKTWAITALYVRLLLETGYTVESILVVTFTEAATSELRDRIRTRLADTRAAFERGSALPGDEIAAALLARVADREQALLRLAAALRDFDQAPVYTIHGFCQRVLGDSAFDAGMPFRTEIVPDQSAILREIVEDFWRREVEAATPLFAGYLAHKGLNPDRLQVDHRKDHPRWELERFLGKPYLRIRKPEQPSHLAGLERAHGEACAAARRLWLAEREAITRKLVGNTSLSGTTYRQSSIPDWIQEIHECLAPASPQLSLCEKFEKFTPESLRKGTRSGGTAPAHPFFEACQALKDSHAALIDAYERSLILMKVRLIEYCDAELKSRKECRQLQSFDDLLLNLQRALAGEQGAAFAKALRARYAVALIDEFQDTDAVQYDIFRRIYHNHPHPIPPPEREGTKRPRQAGGTERPPEAEGTEPPVLLVGDPKQSIYSFRGADVYAYIGARSDARYRHTLDVNWRSAAPLLSAVNDLFQSAPHPFVIEEIGFKPSQSARGNRGRFVVDDEEAPPFEIWSVEGEGGKTINKGAATEAACRATAAEIARLLSLGVRNVAWIEAERGSRALCGGDVAVIVRTHRQGAEMRAALAACGIASVLRGAASVFASREAEELERVLAAIAEPGREPLIGAALATDMMGISGEALYALHADEKKWEEKTESFRQAHREWHEAGFVRMLRAFLKRHDVLVRLLGYVDGERRATNLLHLTELLHSDAERQGIGALLAWLAAKRAAPAEANEPELLRLESDENLVKILTVHAAKGLEFPLVFCPFAWDFTPRRWNTGEAVRFHDPDADYAPTVDFGSAALEAARTQAALEERAETLRLLYVALTRAKYRLWMVWGNVRDAEWAAPAWLIHRRTGEAVEAFGVESVRLTNECVREDLARLVERAQGSIRVSPLPSSEGAPFELPETHDAALGAKAFSATLHETRWVTSFTALAHGRSVEAPDYDASDRESQPESASGRDIFAFPRGAQAGKCLHAIFEQVDFVHLARPELERLVAKELAAHGFQPPWVRVVADMVESVVATPLDAGGMRLDAIPRKLRLDELEFYYPISNLSDARLKALLRGGGFPQEIRERIGELTFAPARGYMRGFIDLVFEHGGRYYLADYKSNWLGPAVNAYSQSALAQAMGREAYYLQYLVYCVALHRYLALRVPAYRYETHFGGVRYLFVRGMHPASGPAFGVHAARPQASFIEALDHYLRTEALP